MPVAADSGGQAPGLASGPVSADRGPFRSWVPGVEQRNLLTSRDHAFVEQHVWLGTIGLSVTKRPPGITTGTVHGAARMISFPMGSPRPERINGRRLRDTYFWIAGEGSDVDIVERDPWFTANIVFPDDAGELDQLRPGGELAVYEVRQPTLGPLRDLVESVIQTAIRAPHLLAEAGVGSAIAENVLVALSRMASGNQSETVRLSFPMAHRLVRKIDEYVNTVGAGHVRARKLSREIGRSLRTIHASLVAVKGVGLSQYLLSSRLWDVRRALETAPPDTLVKTIALDNGFWHLGRFAQRYREQFGETPSETLHNRCGG